MMGLDAYGVLKLQFNTVLGFFFTIVTIILALAYTAVEI